MACNNCIQTCKTFLCKERDLKHFIDIGAKVIVKGLINSIYLNVIVLQMKKDSPEVSLPY